MATLDSLWVVFSGRRKFCTPLVVESLVIDESSVPSKTSDLGRREFSGWQKFCTPLVVESLVLDENFVPPKTSDFGRWDFYDTREFIFDRELAKRPISNDEVVH